jgi:hypothetical protein
MQTITTIGLDIAKSVFHFTELMPPVRGVVHRSHFAWRQTGSPPDTATDQIRTGDQPQDRQGARPRRASLFAAARRRGDRIVTLIAAVHESLVGTNGHGRMSDLSPLSRVKRKTYARMELFRF